MGLNVRTHTTDHIADYLLSETDPHDTNHARGYIVFPTARRDAVAPMSDAALDGFYHAPYYGECERGPFLKDSN